MTIHSLALPAQVYRYALDFLTSQPTPEQIADFRQRLQTQLTLTALRATDTATQIDQRLTRAQHLVNSQLQEVQQVLKREQDAMLRVIVDERAEMLDAISQERAAMLKAMKQERAAVKRLLADERAAMAQRAQELTAQQKDVLEKETRGLIVGGLDAWVKRSDLMVQQVIKDVRGKHYWQACAWACGSALGIMCLTLLGQGIAQRYSEGGRFERWNQSQLKDCRYVDGSTCNFHIKPPQ